ncbi:hypothetical protein Tco_0892864 [Tanacetum coccineum]|uniref:Uncharacterized protein n=1 Tax=Tanacetum coccineum TaxID=301880 RepID=A0ABQ5C8U6_9ASTR
MTTGGEPFVAPIEKEANTSSDPNITFFIVQNLDRVNAMYTAFTHVRKDVSHRSLPTSENPSGEPCNFDSEEAHTSKAMGKLL